jgi:hypothetical protein
MQIVTFPYLHFMHNYWMGLSLSCRNKCTQSQISMHVFYINKCSGYITTLVSVQLFQYFYMIDEV